MFLPYSACRKVLGNAAQQGPYSFPKKWGQQPQDDVLAGEELPAGLSSGAKRARSHNWGEEGWAGQGAEHMKT